MSGYVASLLFIPLMSSVLDGRLARLLARLLSGAWRFDATDDGGCLVTFRYNFTCHPPYLAGPMERIGR